MREYPYPPMDLANELGMTVDTLVYSCVREIKPWPKLNGVLQVASVDDENLIRRTVGKQEVGMGLPVETYGPDLAPFDGGMSRAEKAFALHRDMTKKDTNPKDAVGVRKAPLSCLPVNVLFEVGIGMLEGARKYGRHNWRAIGVRASVYYDAAMRHLAQWWEGEDLDDDSGIHHISKAIACLLVLRDAQIRKMCQDDRPPSSGEWLPYLNVVAGDVIDKYQDAKEPYTNESFAKVPLRVVPNEELAT